MELCDICTRLTSRQWRIIPNSEIGEIIEHHKSYVDICEAATQGCNLCTRLKDVLINWMDNERAEFRQGEWANWTPEKEQFFDFEKFGLSFVFVTMQDTGRDTDGRTRIRSLKYRFSSESERNKMRALQYGDLLDSINFSLMAPCGLTSRTFYLRSQGRGPNLSLAKEWTEECISNHPECAQRKLARNPTRLLYLEDPDRIRLLELPRRSELLHYVALSHRWGELKPLILEKHNYSTHKDEGIAFSSLPQSFQDAVTVTRCLGIRYLWIDSLCIIQNSQEDWIRECAAMANVYSNAVVTIAASDASDSSKGFLHNYSTSRPESFEFQFEYHDADEHQVHLVTMADRKDFTFDSVPTESTLLSKRGWTLQERHLSTRILSFTQSHLVWECCTQSGIDTVTNLFHPMCVDNEYNWTPKLGLGDLQDRATAKQKWYWIVEEFTERELTYEMDKLPALSGLARTFSAVGLGPYMAGLWKESLPGSLLWGVRTRKSLPKDKERDTVPVPLGGPSWSWASVSGCSIYFEEPWGSLYSDVSLLDVQTAIRGCDPFGRVEHGVIRLDGRLRLFRMVYKPPQSTSSEEIYIIDQQDRECGSVRIDHRELVQQLCESGATVVIFVMLMQVHDVGLGSWTGLALEQVVKESPPECLKKTFIRIGVVTGLGVTLESNEYRRGRTLFDRCERKIIEII